MLFNSIDFAFFLPVVFILYWFGIKKLKLQNLLIVVASYVFYGWWDWRFLSLILFSTFVDYSVGLKLSTEENKNKRKLLLWTSIIVNIGFLGFFKYYNFFLDNFILAFTFFGKDIQPNTLNIILPVGISFYTFQTLSYTIDIYKKRLNHTKDIIAFSAFVSFFPQLVAGPIERASNLLPQFYKKRTFNYQLAINGLEQIFWGLFKKVVIADNCAEYANLIFNNYEDYSGSTLALGAIFFAFQIYGDFSGYSDIAIGVSRLFGFNLMRNFAYPYFSRDIAEFWRRWHISLSTWFRDYLYIPLGGSSGNLMSKFKNTLIIFIVSGFWHGANWTFIAWGAINAILFLPLLIFKQNKKNIEIVAKGKILPSIKDFISIIITFSLTCIAWIFFRANDIAHAIEYIDSLFTGVFQKIYYIQTINLIHWDIGYLFILTIAFFILIEWLGREKQFSIEHISKNRLARYTTYYILIIMIFWYGGNKQEFIYFQF